MQNAHATNVSGTQILHIKNEASDTIQQGYIAYFKESNIFFHMVLLSKILLHMVFHHEKVVMLIVGTI